MLKSFNFTLSRIESIIPRAPAVKLKKKVSDTYLKVGNALKHPKLHKTPQEMV